MLLLKCCSVLNKKSLCTISTGHHAKKKAGCSLSTQLLWPLLALLCRIFTGHLGQAFSKIWWGSPQLHELQRPVGGPVRLLWVGQAQPRQDLPGLICKNWDASAKIIINICSNFAWGIYPQESVVWLVCRHGQTIQIRLTNWFATLPPYNRDFGIWNMDCHRTAHTCCDQILDLIGKCARNCTGTSYCSLSVVRQKKGKEVPSPKFPFTNCDSQCFKMQK